MEAGDSGRKTCRSRRNRQINKALEPLAKENWELEIGMKRMGLRTEGGRKPVWKWDEKHGKVARKGKGGSDWYRYQKTILLPKLLPFAKECIKDRPDTIVQEDKAPGHASKHQDLVFMDAEVLRLLWPGNSPDLNMIEQCWPWMKRQTTRKGAPRNRITAIKAWTRCWTKTLKQKKIQQWIERIPRHIEEVIALNGGNEYREGRDNGVVRPYNSEDRRIRYRKDIISDSSDVD